MGATKTSKPGQTKICILPFLKVTDICPASVFRHYLERTKSFRSSSNDEDHVFISFLKPYRKVCSATIARWIKDILRLAGVDTGVFTAHSTRGASTSAALRAGMAVEDIMKVADWTRVATFKRFYFRGTTSHTSLAAYVFQVGSLTLKTHLLYLAQCPEV
ncbi:hypothetical protein HOLleu_42962 [Holothuria leucospilota]|uniref:Tyr recombinase domain-containing protein n=1 Tax=Holothuria leucospilota TaxID=206669 RepID=A0A9Q0YC87_HOLLE|nr:hypothetical protein HOLleu_42962 [Holothuria leucospilota]